MARKKAQAFRTITEVSDWLDTPSHVLRFWESKFPQIKPVKRAGGRRYYRPEDLKLIGGIKVLLHDQGTTIASVKEMIKSEGEEAVERHSPAPEFPEKGRRKLRKAKAEAAKAEKQKTQDEPKTDAKPEPKAQPLVLEPTKPARQPLILDPIKPKETPLTLTDHISSPSDNPRQTSARDVIAQAASRKASTSASQSDLHLGVVKSRSAVSENTILEIEDLYFQLQRVRNRMKRRLEAL